MSRFFFLAAWLAMAVGASAQVTLSVVQNGTATAVPQIYDFGNVALGSVAAAEFELTNAGSSAVYLTSLDLNSPLSGVPPYTSYFSVVCSQSPDLCGSQPEQQLPIQINPSGTLDFVVQFDPFQLGSPSATLTANAGNVVSVFLTGTGVAGFALLWNAQPVGAGETISFGQVPVGTSQSVTIVFSNSGTAALTVPIIPALTSSQFSLSGTALASPSVAPGSSAQLVITFTPSTTGIQQATLTIALATYTLEGTGVAPPPAAFPVPSIEMTPTALASAQQGSLIVNLASAPATAGTGTVTLTFQSAVSGVTDDPTITFADGTRSATFTVAQGATSAQFAGGPSLSFGTGTTAGTIAFSAVLGSNTAQSSVTIAPAMIAVDAAVAARDVECDPAVIYCTTTNVELQVNGWDNTRTISALAFTFYDQYGDTISPGPIDVSAGSSFETYFTGSDMGGVFGLTAFFPVNGDSDDVVAAIVQLTNSLGATQSSQITF